jgi:hypothetical protein
MAHNLDQTDQLTFVGRELEMTSSEGSAEESEGSNILMENGTEPHTRRVIVHHELLVEVGHLEDEACGQDAFKRLERHFCLVILGEGILLQ